MPNRGNSAPVIISGIRPLRGRWSGFEELFLRYSHLIEYHFEQGGTDLLVPSGDHHYLAVLVAPDFMLTLSLQTVASFAELLPNSLEVYCGKCCQLFVVLCSGRCQARSVYKRYRAWCRSLARRILAKGSKNPRHNGAPFLDQFLRSRSRDVLMQFLWVG